ncbi:hypothetical protein HMPREF9120_02016 [Neisseria sp. oral taxon 020 str. F0370]|nr:hypothetical protein HMPREF9120_02016 [Neisseria sp. oral taxon 020 str. F0370]
MTAHLVYQRPEPQGFGRSKKDEKPNEEMCFVLSGLASLNVYANGCPGQFDP